MNKLVIKGIYKHFKGDLYLVEDTGIDSETDKEVVIYRGLYGKSQVYVRPLDSFLSEVDHVRYPDIVQKYKFELQEIESKRKK